MAVPASERGSSLLPEGSHHASRLARNRPGARDYRKSLLAETAKEREELLRFAHGNAAIVASVDKFYPKELAAEP